jgi:hypothetical protein
MKTFTVKEVDDKYEKGELSDREYWMYRQHAVKAWARREVNKARRELSGNLSPCRLCTRNTSPRRCMYDMLIRSGGVVVSCGIKESV